MGTTRKRKPAAASPASKTSAKTSPKTSPNPSPKTRRERAPHIRNWLAFIRPHADRYEALPRGEQRKLIEKLVKTSGSSENTLRRYIAAARVLEAHGIRDLPAGRRYLPVASIEAIERIGKKDPARGRELFAYLQQGMAPAATHRVKAELADARKRAKRSDRKDGPAPLSRMEVTELMMDLVRQDQRAHRPNVDRRLLQFMTFGKASSGLLANMFARAAAPQSVITLSGLRLAAVFDERALVWTGGPALVTREFLRNIVIAVATFEYVVVLCDLLTDDVEGMIAEMLPSCRDRIAVAGRSISRHDGWSTAP